MPAAYRELRLVFRSYRLTLLDVGDNDRSSLKAYRDGICKALGIKDGPKDGHLFEYLPQQKIHKAEREGVSVLIYPKSSQEVAAKFP